MTQHYHLEIYEDPNSYPDSEFYRDVLLLPKERHDKVMRFVNMIDRKLSLLAYKLLRQGLTKHFNIPHDEMLRIGYYRNDKPILLDYPSIYFNISHCHEAVVCAFSDRPIGVDVEGLIDLDEDLLLRVANDEEYQTIVKAKVPQLEFTFLWTKKESYMKMSGIGLVDDLHSVFEMKINPNIHFDSRYSEQHNYAMSICYLVFP